MFARISPVFSFILLSLIFELDTNVEGLCSCFYKQILFYLPAMTQERFSSCCLSWLFFISKNSISSWQTVSTRSTFLALLTMRNLICLDSIKQWWSSSIFSLFISYQHWCAASRTEDFWSVESCRSTAHAWLAFSASSRMKNWPTSGPARLLSSLSLVRRELCAKCFISEVFIFEECQKQFNFSAPINSLMFNSIINHRQGNIIIRCIRERMRNQQQGSIPNSASIIRNANELSPYHSKSNRKPDKYMKYSKSQVKSASTLPSYNYRDSQTSYRKIANAEEHIRAKNQFQRFKLDSSKLMKKHHISSRHECNHSGYIQTKPSLTAHSKPLLYNQIIDKMQQENAQLRSKLLNHELKERTHMDKIYELEKMCATLQNLLSKAHTKSKQESQFLRVMRKTYSNNFDVSDLKGIWRMQKDILRHWMTTTKGHERDSIVAKSEQNKKIRKKAVECRRKEEAWQESSSGESVSSLEIKIRSNRSPI